MGLEVLEPEATEGHQLQTGMGMQLSGKTACDSLHGSEKLARPQQGKQRRSQTTRNSISLLDLRVHA